MVRTLTHCWKDQVERGRHRLLPARAQKWGPRRYAAGLQLSHAQLRPAAALPPFLTARSPLGLVNDAAPVAGLLQPQPIVKSWGLLLGDVPAATAILDRFLQQAEIIQITGRSYRLRHAQAHATAELEKKTADPDKKSNGPAPEKKW